MLAKKIHENFTTRRRRVGFQAALGHLDEEVDSLVMPCCWQVACLRSLMGYHEEGDAHFVPEEAMWLRT